MRIDIKNNEEHRRVGRRGRLSRLGWAVLAIVGLGLAPAQAAVWFTQDALLDSFFPGAGGTVTTAWPVSSAQSAAFKAKVGYSPPAKSYTWFTPDSEAAADIALIDEQLGQHEPITFGVLLGPDCAVKRVEIMVYREAYGEGVRAPAFRDQFFGRKAADPMRAGKEIHIVSGATVSSRSLSLGVRRAAALCEVWRAG